MSDIFVKQILKKYLQVIPAGIYLFKFNSRNSRKRCGMCLKLTIKTSERRDDDAIDVALVSLFLDLNVSTSSNAIVETEQVNPEREIPVDKRTCFNS